MPHSEKNSKMFFKMKNEGEIIFFYCKISIFIVNLVKRPFQTPHKKVKLDDCIRSYVQLKVSILTSRYTR